MGLWDRVGEAGRNVTAGADAVRSAVGDGADAVRDAAGAGAGAVRDAAGAGAGAVRGAVEGGAGAVRDAVGDGAGAVRGADGWVLQMLDAFPRPSAEDPEPWKLSIGTLLAAHPKAPRFTAKVLSLLDGLGAIEVGPERVGFDGDTVVWEKVTEIRVRPVGEVATVALWDFAVDDLRGKLPPIPGRKWAISKTMEIVLALLANVEPKVEAERAGTDEEPLVAACEIVYPGVLGRSKKLEVGIFSGLALCNIPQVTTVFTEIAGRHGIPVVAAAPHERLAMNQRVLDLRARRAALAAQTRELEAAEDLEAPDDPSPSADPEAHSPG